MSTFGSSKASDSHHDTRLQPFLQATNRPQRAAIFMSGSGANAEAILRMWRAGGAPQLEIVALVSDRPQRSRTQQIADTFNLPMISEDIFAFYRAHGLKRVSLATPEACELRNRWTDALRRKLAPLALDFGIFAGFVPLCNIAADFPCLNVHPGDLTVLREQQRYLVGLHTIPIERAILAGHDSLRSSVIVAQPFIAGGDNMDSGPLLGISAPVPVDLQGAGMAALHACAAERPAVRPARGFGDLLEQVADDNLERLKHGGDLVLFPRVVADFAAGRFAQTADEQLFYADGPQWTAVQTVVYSSDTSPTPLLPQA